MDPCFATPVAKRWILFLRPEMGKSDGEMIDFSMVEVRFPFSNRVEEGMA
jgi:hypothetical protein